MLFFALADSPSANEFLFKEFEMSQIRKRLRSSTPRNPKRPVVSLYPESAKFAVLKFILHATSLNQLHIKHISEAG